MLSVSRTADSLSLFFNSSKISGEKGETIFVSRSSSWIFEEDKTVRSPSVT